MPTQAVIGFCGMNSDESSPPRRSARILSFRRGRSAALRQSQGPAQGLAKYEQDDPPDDYRHRMMVNAAAFLFVLVLVCAGYWLAETMARMRKDQDCVLSGRRNCSPAIV